ncbi:heavy metal translocating P-type ATPase [Pirellulaceae bacterium SH467]
MVNVGQNTLKKKHQAASVPCAHCGLPSQPVGEGERAFCCNGCRGAFALIHEMGLEDYYALRPQAAGDYVRESEQQVAALADLQAAGVEVQHLPGGMDCVRLNVEGLHCAACSWLIERMQPSIPGLHSARVRMSDHSVELIYDPEQTSVARVASRLARLGYPLSPWQDDPEFDTEVIQRQREHWIGIALAAFLAANAMWIGISLYAGEATGISRENEAFLRWVGAILGLLAAAFPGGIFFQTAWHAVRNRIPHVDIPVAISLAIGTIGSLVGAWNGSGHMYFDSLASLVLLLRVGRYLQFRAQSQARHSISRLLRWNTHIAKKLVEGGRFVPVPASRLQTGDRVQIDPGEVIPADGIVVLGESQLDTSLLTGETLPVPIHLGERVVGGTMNLTSPLEVLVEAAGGKSRVGKLMAMVRDATTYETPWIQAADKVGKWFVIVVLMLAVGTWCGWAWVVNGTVATQHTMALLTIACPCALALAAPLVITIALGRAAKRQIWIRDGICLEKLARPGMLWLDKTGTLTLGRVHVHGWIGDDRWIPMIAAAEGKVNHPMAAAILRYADALEETNEPLRVTESEQVQGFGTKCRVNGIFVAVGNARWMNQLGFPVPPGLVEAVQKIANRGQSTVYAVVDQDIVGVFAMGDALRPDAVASLRGIQGLGWKLGILSGDHRSVVASIAENLREHGVRIDEVLGEQSPEEKLARIEKSKRSGEGVVVMVGDGVNDAAALAAADVGIAVRGNSEQSLAIAPIYIASQKLTSVVDLLSASKQVVLGIRGCFIASLLYNSITISLAMGGWIHPLVAALFMPLSGITVLAMAFQSRAFRSKISTRTAMESP